MVKKFMIEVERPSYDNIVHQMDRKALPIREGVFEDLRADPNVCNKISDSVVKAMTYLPRLDLLPKGDHYEDGRILIKDARIGTSGPNHVEEGRSRFLILGHALAQERMYLPKN